MRSLSIFSAMTCATVLLMTACGGGSDSSSTTGTTGATSTSGGITVACAVSGNTISVTTDGCIANAEKQRTALCVGNTMYMLDGTGLTQAQVKQGVSITAASITSQGYTYKCV